ncbi:penicillin-binding transpeptidase domain-containing protein [Lactococcus ileimucosae]|uniref:Penicillin-binding transpeptidase domain-containing protein n=1 Tax=Lactococcus ileimucosae TaxID=2941329 RepID=A0ABV4D0W7_9LACT|nr:penicillin-binding transpeptidase domain-containing protein [Lactococcus ileimucosae]
MKNIFRIITLPFRRISKKAKKSHQRPEENRKRVGKSLFLVAIALFAIFIFRFVWIITVNEIGGVNLSEMAKTNYLNTTTVYAKRGTIFDRNGVPLAVDASDYTVYAVLDKAQVDNNNNKLYVDKAEFPKVTEFLNKELGIDKKLIEQQLNSGKAQVQFGSAGTKIPLAKMEQMKKDAADAGIVGIGFTANVTRSNPEPNYASQFIGIAQQKTPGDPNSGLVGINGLEASFNDILSGSNGEETYEKDRYGRPLPGTTTVSKPVKNGQDIYTTLDARLQSNLETLMDEAVKRSGGQQLSATLMDAHTGDILATTQRPTFSSNNFNDKATREQPHFTENSMLYQSQFEPGSVMKTFLMASALDSDKVDLNASYYRRVNLYDVVINDWDANETEDGSFKLPSTVTFAEGFKMSSNTGMTRIVQNMGTNLWDSYLRRFRFGIPTRIGMGGEQFGSLPDDSNPVSQVQSSFGQGISTTQIQLLRGWTSFANKGEMLEPHIVDKIVNKDNNTYLKNQTEVIGRPVSENAVNKTKDLMVGVNTDPRWGTSYLTTESQGHAPGPLFMVNGNTMAVKTGTAQIASETGGYLKGMQDNIYSAVAMYPPENPDFIFYMNIKIPSNPWSLTYISDVANPLMTRAEQIKNQDAAASDMSNLKEGKVTIGDYEGEAPGKISDELRRNLIAPVVIGQGTKITEQSVPKGEEVKANSRVMLLTDGDHFMPDMFKWSKEQVEQLAKWYNLKVEYQGSGDHVNTQSVAMGTKLKDNQTITVTMN